MRLIARALVSAAALIAVLMSAAPSASAQDGPPPHVRELVDSVVAMLDSDGDAAIESFIDEAIAASAVDDRAALAERLKAMRAATDGLRGELSVEGEPNGVRLILAGDGREEQIRVTFGPEGISDLVRIDAGRDGASAGGGEAPASGDEESAVGRHVRALEESFRTDLDELAADFDAEHFAPSYLAGSTAEERRILLDAVQKAARTAGGAFIDVRGDDLVLILKGDGTVEVSFRTEPEAPFGITHLDVRETEAATERMTITRDNLAATFDQLEADGVSGLVHVRLDGEIAYQRAFGMASEELGVPNRVDTVFGTGSRPIDYTIAAIYLLNQQGRIGLDDSVDKHFDDVPDDKKSMTIRHLMSGQSGLPDFVDTADDWDADLKWIDRGELERRILAADLLFAPGSDRKHSHAAFGLLAAVIERISGQDYYTFLRENFFDPAGMTRTGEYGESRGLSISDFAVGGGPKFVGVPNIPPNWGPTSWLVKGSGGMYSTLGDLQKFYAYLRSGDVLDDEHSAPFRSPVMQVDGSERGFELFSAYNPETDSEAYLFLNTHAGLSKTFRLFDAMGELVEPRR